MKTISKFWVLLAALIGGGMLHAQDFSMDWFGLAGGGGSSLGGDVQLSATIGQPATGEITGGDFSITGGFWSIAAVEEPGQPALTISLLGDRIIISWPESGSAGFVLEETGVLGMSWAPVSEAPQISNGLATVRLLLAPGNHFYRLHKP